MTVKSHRIHGKRVSSSQEFQTVLRISERTREMGIENHLVDWTTERQVVGDLLECWFCGGDWAEARLEKMESLSSETSRCVRKGRGSHLGPFSFAVNPTYNNNYQMIKS